MLKGKSILITGGTGSLGKVLTKRLLSMGLDGPDKIRILSRDEAKQHNMRLDYLHRRNSTEETIYDNFSRKLEFRIGDVRNYSTLVTAMKEVDIVINAAALKQVPTCEYFPYEAVQTNVSGPDHIVRACTNENLNVKMVIGVSTDKACKPVNVMGLTKALQEKIFISGNISSHTKFVCVRYGNVLASRGSVIPLFHDQIKNGGPLTITTADMTRFLLSLENAVDTVLYAIEHGQRGDTIIPRVPSARITDIAKALIQDRNISIQINGIRPGEKIHEILISEEEANRAFLHSPKFFIIKPALPELWRPNGDQQGAMNKEYSSADDCMSIQRLHDLLACTNLLVDSEKKPYFQEDLLG